MKNKLAIVIPYYKIDFFEETIKSVASQKDKNFSLYIGNDNSPDDPLPIIKKYLKDDEYKYFYYEENLGGKNLALQWERILENITEEWFQILGDDDVIPGDFVEKAQKSIAEAENKKISVIKFSHQWIDDHNQVIQKFNYPFKIIKSTDFFLKKYNDEIKSSLSENIFKTSVYKIHKFEKLPLAWGTDDFAILTISNFKEILYINETIVNVRVFSNSISGSSDLALEKRKASLLLRELILIKYSEKFQFEILEKILSDYIYFCYKYKIAGNYFVSKIYIKNFNPIKLFKSLSAIYKLKKNAA